MNIREISRNDQNPQWWIFVGLAVTLMGLTVGIWTSWSIWGKRKKNRKLGNTDSKQTGLLTIVDE
jgi:hypothetical protein